MSYKRQIKKKVALRNQEIAVQINKKTKQIVFNFLLTIMLFCILCIISDNSVASSALLGGYEVFIFVLILKTVRDSESEMRKYLGIWNLFFIIVAGILFRLKYEFYEVPENLFAMSVDEIKALLISFVVAVCVMKMIDKIASIKLDTWIKVILVCVLSFSVIGQVLLFNDLVSKEKDNKEYYVSEKQINDRIFKSYLVSIESDKNHGFVLSVGKEKFSQISINDKYLVTIRKGLLGIEYVKKKGII